MLMPGKQFKIINHKSNSLIQIQVDSRGLNSVSALEIDVMLKSQEHRLKMAMD